MIIFQTNCLRFRSSLANSEANVMLIKSATNGIANIKAPTNTNNRLNRVNIDLNIMYVMMRQKFVFHTPIIPNKSTSTIMQIIIPHTK